MIQSAKIVFSLNDFVVDLIRDLDGPELSWDFKISCHNGNWSVRTGRMTFAVEIPIKLYGSRQDWVKEHVLEVARKHDLEVTTVPDFTLYGYFTNVLGVRE